jgi:hypothetical protein
VTSLAGRLEQLVADRGEEDDEGGGGRGVLGELKADPGQISLDSLLAEVDKLERIRSLGLPAGLFAGAPDPVVGAWRARAALEYPSDLRERPRPVRLTLLAALCWTRTGEITDGLVELLIGIVHKIGTRAENRVEGELLADLRRVRGKEGIRFRLAEAAVEHAGAWRMGDSRFRCAACDHRTSVTAGTIFDWTRTPLTVWFHACWLFATAKDGVSALTLQRALAIGSYQTAWAMLHRLRSVLVRPGRDRLAGMVEVDETYIGGEEPGLRGGRARGKKVLTCIAVEIHEPKGLGRCRMAPITDASGASLHAFVTDHVEPGTVVLTDGWQGYAGLGKLGYVHQRRSQRAARARGEDPHELLPGVHRSPRLPNGGCSAPIRARWTTPTCRTT